MNLEELRLVCAAEFAMMTAVLKCGEIPTLQILSHLKVETILELNLFIPLIVIKTLPGLSQILRALHKFLSKGTLYLRIIGAEQKRFCVKN